MNYFGSLISIEDATGILERAIEIINILHLSLGLDPAERCLNSNAVMAAATCALDEHLSGWAPTEI